MTKFAALLRAVNLPSHQKLKMADLSAFIAALGLRDPKTLLASGNVVFGGDGTSAALEARLERESAVRLSLATEFFVRTSKEMDAIVAANPFPDAARDDPSHLVVMFLKAAPAPARVKALQAAIRGRELVRAEGRQAYFTYPDGIGNSKVTNALIERHLGTRGTARNWNTLRKLQALLGDGMC